jgi:hypothetical protein
MLSDRGNIEELAVKTAYIIYEPALRGNKRLQVLPRFLSVNAIPAPGRRFRPDAGRVVAPSPTVI